LSDLAAWVLSTRASDTGLGGRIVAVKDMTEEGLSPQEIAEAATAFQQEAHLLAGLHHPNLPAIHDHFTDGGRWYLVMDFIEGQTLEEYLQHHGTPGLPVAEVLRLADQICAVLQYLHAYSPPIIFRDLKPSNIMLTPSGHLYLIDFGIARIFKPGQTRDTMPIGTEGYAAPEQYGKTQTTVRSDIYSFGVILHQLLTGIDPAVKPFTFPWIRPLNPQVPPLLEALIMQMVQLDESRRPLAPPCARR
jgi:serine/threonine protein kinase